MLKFKRFLVPVDFSEESRVALEFAVQLVKKEGRGKVYLLHVLPPVRAIDYPGPLMKDMKTLVQRQEERSRADLDKWRTKIPSHYSSKLIITRGHAGNSILDVCQKYSIDLVVMTTHGRRGMKRLAHPNLSEKIVRRAPCPVLVLHLKGTVNKAGVAGRRRAA
ncbi:MAG: hypothetical protein KCHDKBKB_03086 [Elusimicrobia bacterium]|nr:hypothetical protein [Elusimicrobiota bacterium]